MVLFEAWFFSVLDLRQIQINSEQYVLFHWHVSCTYTVFTYIYVYIYTNMRVYIYIYISVYIYYKCACMCTCSKIFAYTVQVSLHSQCIHSWKTHVRIHARTQVFECMLILYLYVAYLYHISSIYIYRKYTLKRPLSTKIRSGFPWTWESSLCSAFWMGLPQGGSRSQGPGPSLPLVVIHGTMGWWLWPMSGKRVHEWFVLT